MPAVCSVAQKPRECTQEYVIIEGADKGRRCRDRHSCPCKAPSDFARERPKSGGVRHRLAIDLGRDQLAAPVVQPANRPTLHQHLACRDDLRGTRAAEASAREAVGRTHRQAHRRDRRFESDIAKTVQAREAAPRPPFSSGNGIVFMQSLHWCARATIAFGVVLLSATAANEK
jgi:hypothetical protein